MRTRKIYYFLVALLALNISIVACGDEGESGIDGLKGEQGIQGEVGPAGADGSIIYSGEGEQTATVGIVGDYYLDVATGMLYGPKINENNWTDTDGFSLKGTNGTEGTDGSKIFSGEDVPSNNFGNTGDFYLDKTNYVLYGPAVTDDEGDTTWGAGLELKGADGNANVKTFKLTINVEDWEISNNVDGQVLKSGAYNVLLSSLTEDIYENGIVLVYWNDTSSANFGNLYLLPKIDPTLSNNTIQKRFYINKTSDVYSIYIKTELLSVNAPSELLTLGTELYQIKVISGQTAVQLKANKDNQIEFNRLVDELVR